MDIQSLASGRITLRHVHCFVAVAQCGTLQRAAERLSISQPAVSKRLAEVEALLGVSLFVRGRQGALLTRDGQRLLPYATQMLSSLRAGLASVGGQEDAGLASAQFGILPTLAATIVPAAFAHMRQSWNDIQLHVTTASNSELLTAVRVGKLAFAVNRAADPELSEGLRFEYLFADPLVVVARPGHPVARSGLRDVVNSGEFPVILPPGGTLIRQSADRLLDEAGIGKPRVMMETLSMSTARVLTLEYDAIWLVPRSAVIQDIDNNSLRIVAGSPVGSEERVGITMLHDATPETAISSLIECLRQVALKRRA